MSAGERPGVWYLNPTKVATIVAWSCFPVLFFSLLIFGNRSLVPYVSVAAVIGFGVGVYYCDVCGKIADRRSASGDPEV